MHNWKECIKFPPLATFMRKGDAGRLGIVGGCEEYTGAPYYAAITAMRLGCDLVHVFCEKSASPVIKSYSPALIVHPYINFEQDNIDLMVNSIELVFPRLDALLIGPGLGRHPKMLKIAERLIEKALQIGMPLAIDADGLFLLCQLDLKLSHRVIITPNYNEFTKLCISRKIAPTEIGAESKLSLELGGATVIRKGEQDSISNGSNALMISEPVGSLRRTGGQGDVLSGAVATLLTWNACKYNNGCTDYCHLGAAACTFARIASQKAFERVGRSMTATDLIDQLVQATAEFEKLLVNN